MEIKDIVEQEKHKCSLAKIKQREEKLTRKQFLKDCYKFWKEYKKVESPYFWWCYFLTFEYFIFGKVNFFRWIRFDAPRVYIEGSWFENKWEYKYDLSRSDYRIIMKKQNKAGQTFIWLKYYD